MGAGPLAAAAHPGKELLFGRQPSSADGAPRGSQRTAGHMDPWIEVDLKAIAQNFSRLRELVKVPIMAVVKANAYGHGLVEVSRALEKAGAEWLMVGKLEEAQSLRDLGINCPILNFGPFNRLDADEIISRKVSQCVFTEEAMYLDEAAAKRDLTGSVHVDIDTGMGRTGVAAGAALPLLKKIAGLSHLRIAGVCTTLTEDPQFDRDQLREFQRVVEAARAAGISTGLRHAASSAGILDSSELYLDMVRPGITLYGYYPNAWTRAEDALKLKPALKLSARVIFLKDVVPGESLSYVRAVKVKKKMRVATVGIGYSDGYPPQLGGRVLAMIKGKAYPVLEAVTANHLMLELGDDQDIRIGDEVTLINPDRSSGLAADSLFEKSGISDYRILIGLNPLTPRFYAGKQP